MIIALKREFYPYIGDRDFTRDWAAELARWKRWRHPFILAKSRKLDREKDAIRKWWFSLSRREQHYWLGRRNDGEFPNVIAQAMRNFKGPARQRGIIQMAFAGQALGGATVLALDAANNSAVNFDVGPTNSLYATFQAQNDGDFRRDNSGDTGIGRQLTNINTATDWITPRGASVGDDFEIKWNFLSGSAVRINDESFTEDVWTALTADERVGQATTLSSLSSVFELDIGDVGTSTSIVNQDYSVEAGDII